MPGLGWYLCSLKPVVPIVAAPLTWEDNPDFKDNLCRMQCILSRKQVARLWSPSANTTTDFLQPLFLYIPGLWSKEENAESAKNCSDSCGCFGGAGIQFWGCSFCWQINSLEKLQRGKGEKEKKKKGNSINETEQWKSKLKMEGTEWAPSSSLPARLDFCL